MVVDTFEDREGGVKKRSQKQRLLDLMQDRRWHTNRTLNDIAFRYGDCLFRLKKEDGYLFNKKCLKRGYWSYRLIGKV